MSENFESQELEYYTLMVKKIAKQRGSNTWNTVQIIEILDDNIVFGMRGLYGRLTISKIVLSGQSRINQI